MRQQKMTDRDDATELPKLLVAIEQMHVWQGTLLHRAIGIVGPPPPADKAGAPAGGKTKQPRRAKSTRKRAPRKGK